MKKVLLLAAVAALVACAEKDNFKEAEEAAIDFSEVFVEKGTKAPYTDVASLKSDTRGFGVFGSKTKQDNTVEKVFGKSSDETNGGAQVTWNSTSSKWTYTPIRYWDKGAQSYHFYAYAPYNAITTGTNRLLGTVSWSESTDNSFKIEGFKQNTTVANMIDILTDLENQINNTSKQNTVNFSFKHILSNINILMAISPDLKDDESDNPVTVNSVSLGDIKMDGSYAYNSGYKWTLANNATTASFDATKNSNNKVFNSGELKATANTSTNSLNTNQIGTTGVEGLQNLLFIPQAFTESTGYEIEIDYLIGTETFNRTINLSSFVKQNTTNNYSTSWEIGYQYNYILVIGPTPIEFGVSEITPWTTNVETYVYTID